MSIITLVQTSTYMRICTDNIDSPIRHLNSGEKGGKKDICTIILRRDNTNMQNKA